MIIAPDGGVTDEPQPPDYPTDAQVEAAAQALCKGDGEHWDTSSDWHDAYKEEARAALLAAQGAAAPPTPPDVEALVEAFREVCEHFSDRPDTGACCHALLDKARATLKAWHGRKTDEGA